ncbi:MAG: Hsp20 family protein [Spirochaeta sp.]|nr:Hsp20 family protein [Spirochaeta sp.]
MRNLVHYTKPADLFDWNSMLDTFFSEQPVWNTSSPAVDIQEDENGYRMEVEIPGLSEKDIELKVEENLITLSTRKEEKKEEKSNGYLLRERKNREFCRSFVLPEDVERESIKAAFKNGLLNVTLPKKEKAKPKLIEVKVTK